MKYMKDGDDKPVDYPAASPDVCRQLRQLCESTRTRTVGIPPKHPSRWQPATVRHPVSGELFNSASAWEFIAECLDGRYPVQLMALNQPPGKTGFVILADGRDGRRIYIKLQLGSGVVIGRSFHVSNEGDR